MAPNSNAAHCGSGRVGSTEGGMLVAGGKFLMGVVTPHGSGGWGYLAHVLLPQLSLILNVQLRSGQATNALLSDVKQAIKKVSKGIEPFDQNIILVTLLSSFQPSSSHAGLNVVFPTLYRKKISPLPPARGNW